MKLKRIGVVSDLHCGHIFGILPPDFVTSEGRTINLNAGQRYLWQCWQDAADRMYPLDALVINGDAIDGAQQKSQGVEFCLPMLEDQSEAAFRAIDFLRRETKAKKVYLLAGTEYHSGRAAREEEVIAQRLGATLYMGVGSGRYCREVLDLEVDGVILNFAHGISIASGLYRATPPDREAVWSALAGKAGKCAKAECVIRSHAHNFVHVEHQSKHSLITPCWQLQTRYMRKNSVYRMMPDIGYVIVEVDATARKTGDDPCHIIKRIYPLPEPKISHL